MIMDGYENAEKDQEKMLKDTVGFDRSSMSPEEKFMEMISQRIGQVCVLVMLFLIHLYMIGIKTIL